MPLGYPLRRLQQVFVIPSEDHQQLDVRVIRVVDHFNRRRLDRRVLAQEVRALIVGRENNGVTVRQLVELDRELLAAPARLAAEPEAIMAAACCCRTSGAEAKTIGSVSWRLSRES